MYGFKVWGLVIRVALNVCSGVVKGFVGYDCKGGEIL